MRLIDADKLPYIKAPIAPILVGNEVVWCDIVYKLRIDNAPTVEAEPIKRGRWIRKESKRSYWFECSECGYPPPLDKFKREWFSNYCPNCGARMDGGENG